MALKPWEMDWGDEPAAPALKPWEMDWGDEPAQEEYPDQVSRAASRPQVTAPPLADTEDSVSRRKDARAAASPKPTAWDGIKAGFGSIPESLQDIGTSALKIGPTALSGVAEVADMLTAGQVDLGVQKWAQRSMAIIDETLGSDNRNASQKGLAALMKDDSKGFGDWMAYAVEHPDVLVDQAITTVGSMMMPIGIAKGVQAGMKTLEYAPPVIAKAMGWSTIGSSMLQNGASTFSELADKPLADRYAGAATTAAIAGLVGVATGGGAEGAIARRLEQGVRAGTAGAMDATLKFFTTMGKATFKEFLQEYGEEWGGVAGESIAGKGSSLQSDLKRTGAAGVIGAIVGGGAETRSAVSGLASDVSASVAAGSADGAQAAAESKAAEMFGGMKQAVPGEARPIQPYTGEIGPDPTQPRLPAPGRTVAEVSAQPLPVTELPAVDPAQAHADQVEAARAAAEASRASANWTGAPAPATQAGAAPQTASQIDIANAPDPAAAIAAIAAAPITQIGAPPAGLSDALSSQSSSDLAATFIEIDQLKRRVKEAPGPQKAALKNQLDALIQGARTTLAQHSATHGAAAAGNLHRAAAEQFHALKGDYAGLVRPVQETGAFTNGEQLNVEVPGLDAKAPPITIPSPIGPAPKKQAEAGDLPTIEMPGATPETAQEAAVPVESAADGVLAAAAQQTYPGSVEARGIHYGTTPGLTSLAGLKYGTGASTWNGEERGRLQTAPDQIRQRVYFYEHEGTKMPEPEGVVTGTHVYEAQIPGLLDIQTPAAKALMKDVPRDATGQMDLNKFEEAVHAAGYTGYKHGNQIVTLGRDVPVRALGTRFEVLQKERKAAAEAATSRVAEKKAELEKTKAEGKVAGARTHPGLAYAPAQLNDLSPSLRSIVTTPAPQEVLDFITADGSAPRDLRASELPIVTGILAGVVKAGVHPSALEGIGSFVVFTGKNDDAQHVSVGNERAFALAAPLLLKLQSGSKAAKQDIVVTFIHETWHNIDTYKDGNKFKAMSYDSPLLAIGTAKNGEREATGEIMQEIADFYYGDPSGRTTSDHAIARLLDYPLDQWNQNTKQDDVANGTKYADAQSNFIKEETMAQLSSVWYTSPTALRNALPKTAKLFEDIDNDISQLPATAGIDRIRSLVAARLKVADPGAKAQGNGSNAQAAQGPGAAAVKPSRQPSNRELTEKDRAGVLDHLSPEERKWVNSAESAKQFVQTFLGMPSSKEMAAIAWAGKAKKGWYRAASYAMHHVFGLDAPRFAVLLAATSPRTSVEDNLKGALQTWVLWNKAGRPQSHKEIEKILRKGVKNTSVLAGTDKNNVIRALTHPDPAAMYLSGPKVNSFFHNLIDNVYEVTNDGWMAAFASVDAELFGGTTTGLEKNKGIVTDPGKRYGYLAMSAHVRQAAKILSEKTGEVWTPAEVQETIWSWAKTLYEMAGVKKSAEDIITNKELTDALIAATPDFGTLFTVGEYAEILRSGGFAEGVSRLAEARRASAENEGRNPKPGDAGQKAPFTQGVQGVFEQRAAKRLDELRKARAADSERKARDKAAARQAAEEELKLTRDMEHYSPDDPMYASPADFKEDPETALLKDGWAIVTATREDKPDPYNSKKNDELLNDIKALGYEVQEVRGMWRGVDQGRSFLLYAPTSVAKILASFYKQEAITTAQGFEYIKDRRIERADHSLDVVGPEALKKDGYTVLADGTPVSMGFPPEGKIAGNRTKVTDSTELAGDGRWSTTFFSEASQGKRAPNEKVPYTPTLDISENADFTAEYVKHRGNFDDHIATSIPGFREVQQAVGDAIVRSYPNGANLLDIAASEGAFNKAITATSGGQIKTLALDPNLTMAKFFKDHSTVPGAEYEVAAFGSAEDAGKLAWTEDDGTDIKTFDPKIKYDVIHESMGFQFISNTRNAQFARAKEMMTPDGIALFEEKIIENTAQWKANEKKKDRYKARYYTEEQLEAKKAEVLEKGQKAADEAEAKREEDIVGMNNLMTTGPEMETALKNNWKYVAQYWDSGNFKGYVASDNQTALQRFLNNLTDLNSEYSNVETPHVIGSKMYDLTTPVIVEAVEAETGRPVEITMPAEEALKSIDADIEQTRKLLLCLSS
jgi:hypothetical protein